MIYSDLVKLLQKAMNSEGESLTVDGDAGPKTKAALEKFNVSLQLSRVPMPEIVKSLDLSTLKKLAPWVFEAITMLGWDEVSKDKQLTALCWPNTDDCKYLKTVIGAINAWCSGFWCGVMAKLALPSTRSGSAASWRTFGIPCGFIFGAFLPIRHKNGSNHITVFLWWIDEAKKIAACLGANQSNKVSIAAYDLSGNNAGHDEVVGGPRWVKGMPMTAGPFQPPGWVVGTKLGASTT